MTAIRIQEPPIRHSNLGATDLRKLADPTRSPRAFASDNGPAEARAEGAGRRAARGCHARRDAGDAPRAAVGRAYIGFALRSKYRQARRNSDRVYRARAWHDTPIPPPWASFVYILRRSSCLCVRWAVGCVVCVCMAKMVYITWQKISYNKLENERVLGMQLKQSTIPIPPPRSGAHLLCKEGMRWLPQIVRCGSCPWSGVTSADLTAR